ncbi:MAG: hypothetical protein MJZ34_02550 [Paludibacteraceae bacterium]|nr:hypothetical protein [Paludibacteraceae bacterium]
MSYEQSLTKRTIICEDRKRMKTVVEETLLYLTCHNQWLCSEMSSSNCRMLAHEDFVDLLNDAVEHLTELTENPGDDEYYEFQHFVNQLKKVDAETNWDLTTILYEAG